MHRDFTQQALTTFTRSIRCITANPPQPCPESLQALYSLCEGCVPAVSTATADSSSSTDAVAQTLYDRIRIELEKKVGDVQRTLTASTSGGTGVDLDAAELGRTTAPSAAEAEAFLSLLDREWNTFTRQLGMIRSIFLHLDRTWVLNQKALLSIWFVNRNTV